MKNNRKILIGAVSLLGSFTGLFAFTATFQASDTAYDWSDSTIWDTVPNAGGHVYIEGGTTTGSSLSVDGLDLSAMELNTSVTDAVLNVVNGASYNFGSGSGDISNETNRTLQLFGNAKFYAKDSTLTMGSYGTVFGSGTSELFIENTAFNSPYGAFFFSDQAKATFDNTTYSVHIWAGVEFSDSARLTVQNGASVSFNNRHSGDIILTDDSQMNILSGASFSSGGTIPFYMEKNAQINLDGVGSTINIQGGIATRTSEDGTAANAKINVANGASFTGSNLALTGTSSLNYTSSAGDENQTTGGINGLSLVDNTSVNASGAQTYITASGTLTGTAGTSINISDSAVVEKSGNPVTLAGDIVANFTEGSRFNAGHREGLFIQDNAKLVVDGAYLGLADYPVITASGGELVFKNGATLTGNDTTSTVGRYGHFNFSGNSKLTMQDTSMSVGMVCDTYDDNSFSGTSSWTLDNATFKDNGFGAFANGLQFSGSASLILKNASSLTWKSIEGATLSAVDSAKIDISGGSSLSAYELSVGGQSGASSLTIRGDGNSVLATSLFSLIGAGGTSFSNQLGGKLLFVADEHGISTLEVNAISEFSGLVELDFSKFSEEGTFEYLLISSVTEWDASAYVSNSEGESDLVNVIKANVGDSWTLDFDGTSLILTYTHVVPEPATCAAVFGALALALAALRRRSGRN